MNRNDFIFTYILLLIAQILLNNFMNISQLLIFTFLPALILFLPIETGTISALFIAFVTGFAVDFLSDGMLGLSSASLLPVALVRRRLISLIFGEEILLRDEKLSIERLGVPKSFFIISIGTAIYLIIYIMLDEAGTRTLTFKLLKFLISLVSGSLVSLPVAKLLYRKEGRRWR